jgi:hypothetical protein
MTEAPSRGLAAKNEIMSPDQSRPFAVLERTLRLSAAGLLVLGLVLSALIWRAQDRIERQNQAARASGADINLSPLDDRRQLQQLELYAGKGGVMVEEAKGLFHGKNLAKTVAVISVVVAAGLFLVSVRWSD